MRLGFGVARAPVMRERTHQVRRRATRAVPVPSSSHVVQNPMHVSQVGNLRASLTGGLHPSPPPPHFGSWPTSKRALRGRPSRAGRGLQQDLHEGGQSANPAWRETRGRGPGSFLGAVVGSSQCAWAQTRVPGFIGSAGRKDAVDPRSSRGQRPEGSLCVLDLVNGDGVHGGGSPNCSCRAGLVPH